MDTLTAFGAFSVSLMMVFYALEGRSQLFIPAFAIACLASSSYGFLAGTVPFGVVELIWAGVALHRWRVSQTASPSNPSPCRHSGKHRRLGGD